MGLLDGLLGGAVGAGVTLAVKDILDKNGGVAGVVKQFQEKGLSGAVSSWVGTGANQPIDSSHVQQVFGAEAINAMAAKAGLNPQDLMAKLAEFLPQAVDKLTPDGRVPDAPNH